jgi:putative multiple sugar transport system permease protein
MAFGLILALIFSILQIRKVSVQKKMGIIQSVKGDYIRTAIIAIVILWVAWKLASYKGIPTVLIWVSLVLLVYNYITTKTAIGRYLYAVGGNEKATQLSGVNTRNVFLFAYANMGFLAGLAGILNVARMTNAQPTFGQGYEMDAIAACFIGGASAYGGTGKISGVIIGALLMGLINQGMSIMGIDSNYQRVVKGLVLMLAVMFDVLSKRQKK